MYFNKMKHDIRARLGAAMTNPNVHESNKPILESDKPRMAYQPPTLTRLEDCDIASGSVYVPEGNNGLLAS
jgi:hypothetical protein